MLPMTYVALFLVVRIIRNDATVFNDVFALPTNDYPKSSCHQISNIKKYEHMSRNVHNLGE